MGLQGNLADLPFQDLVGSVLRNKRNAQQNKMLVVCPPAQGYKATIIFHNGLLHAAWITYKSPIGTVVKYLGDDVIAYLLECEGGDFMLGALAADYTLPERNILQNYPFTPVSAPAPVSPVAAIQPATPRPTPAKPDPKPAQPNLRAGATKILDKSAVNTPTSATSTDKNQPKVLTGLLNRFRHS